MWLFHLRSMVNIQPLSPVFPLMGYGYGMLLIIPSEFQEAKHQPFLVAQPFQKSAAVIEKALSEHMVVLFHQYTDIYTFFIFPLVGSMIGGFYWLFLWNFKK
ncbi:hypothetical protein [uncultured Bilophila sp.]|uniref:hypothetical protein n=1 Tax=uncultured Bilophila sp. TaxID=529385 RepID=UPI00280A816B|nr:hypothetical protein [uncultured Bilophila sp.]